MNKVAYNLLYYFISLSYFFFKKAAKCISLFYKNKENSDIYFLTENNIGTNIRLIKIAKALNLKNKKPILIIHKNISDYNKYKNLFKKIVYYRNLFELIHIVLSIGKNPLHAYVEGNLREIFLANIFKINNFFFDNYDQVSEIWDNNLKSIIEKIIIFNSINITRSKELNLLKNKKIKYIFFSDYISDLNTSEKKLIKKINKKTIDVCYVGKLKEANEWGDLNTYDPNFNETIIWFSKFRKINLHVFPSKALSNISFKKYFNLCKKYKNISFNKNFEYSKLLKKISYYDCGIIVFPIDNWPNQRARKKYKYAMGNKIFDYLGSGLISIFPFYNKRKVNWFTSKFLEKYNACCYIDKNWNEDKIIKIIRKHQKNLKISNIKRNLVYSHIDRLLSKYHQTDKKLLNNN